MYVRKFQGESIDETIKLIKKELGPEAIILKTETFKGIKSALKKSKVEITAAITEKNLKKKMNVDKVLNDEQKEIAYSTTSNDLLNMIDNYDQTNENLNSNRFGYGNISLNKNVQSKAEDKAVPVVNELVNASSLDSFLSEGKENEVTQIRKEIANNDVENKEANCIAHAKPNSEVGEGYDLFKNEVYSELASIKSRLDSETIESLQEKIECLEKSISNINFNKSVKNDEVEGVSNILLRAGVSEEFINKEILHSFYRSLKKEDLNKKTFIDHCVEVCKKTVRVNDVVVQENMPKAFIYLSTSGSGQSTLIKKIIKKQGNGELFTLVEKNSNTAQAKSSEILGINNYCFDDPARLFAAVRKSLSHGCNAHVDLKIKNESVNDILQILDLFKTSIKSSVISLTTSGRFSYRYNQRLLDRFNNYADLFNITYLDECYEIGSIFNLFYDYPNLKASYISTGEVIPDDLMVANANVIIEKLFNV